MAHRYVAGDAHRCGESHRLREACRERCAACLRVRCPTSQRLLYLVPASLTLSVTVETASNLSRSTRVPYPHLSRSAKDQPVATHNSDSRTDFSHTNTTQRVKSVKKKQPERSRGSRRRISRRHGTRAAPRTPRSPHAPQQPARAPATWSRSRLRGRAARRAALWCGARVRVCRDSRVCESCESV